MYCLTFDNLWNNIPTDIITEALALLTVVK